MKKLFLLFLLVTFKLGFAQSGWFWQNPKPTGSGFSDAVYLNSSTIYALGGNGEFLKSTDGGLSWTIKNIIIHQSLPEKDFAKISVVNAQTIFVLAIENRLALSDIYTLYKSTDGGNQWSSALIDSVSHAWFNNMKFTNANTGYCFHSFDFSNRNIFRTTDAGLTWNRLIVPGTDTLYALSFPSENTGYFCGAGKKIYKTTNAGVNWVPYPLPAASNNYEQTFFINENTGWILNYNRIYKTVNGGTSFVQQGTMPASLSGFYFCNESTGFTTENEILYRTVNSGANWAVVDSMAAYVFSFINGTTGITTGSYGEISRTTDAGLNWIQLSQTVVPLSYTVSTIDFSNENYGWATADNRLLRTTNGGDLWISLPDSSRHYNSVKFLNQTTGTFSTIGGIYLTTNSGNNWSQVTGSTYSNIDFRSVSMPSASVWYCPGFKIGLDESVLLKSTNAGLNWQPVTLPPALLIDVFFIDASTGYMATFGGIYKTTNGGNSWSMVTGSLLTSLFFTDTNTGWALNSSQINKTTNGGVNWTPVFYDNTFSVYTLKFANALTGWACTSVGRILKTTNGGANFFYTNYASYSRLVNFSILNENTVWACGEHGAILKTTTGGEVSVRQISSQVPDKFYLEQNYPNPFNPVTNIEFSLPQKSFVRLKVFDLLGREVSSLVNLNLSAGKYKYDFNASALPSGIYFYKLETENFSETRKMVLVK